MQSFVSDMQRLTRRHTTMKCYGLGLGLDTFRIVSLGENFRRLDPISVMNAYSGYALILYSMSYTLSYHSIHHHRQDTLDVIAIPLCLHIRGATYFRK